jgi:hypothetical protein
VSSSGTPEQARPARPRSDLDFQIQEIRDYLQGPPLGIDIMYLVLADRNMQVRFGLKMVWES